MDSVCFLCNIYKYKCNICGFDTRNFVLMSPSNLLKFLKLSDSRFLLMMSASYSYFWQLRFQKFYGLMIAVKIYGLSGWWCQQCLSVFHTKFFTVSHLILWPPFCFLKWPFWVIFRTEFWRVWNIIFVADNDEISSDFSQFFTHFQST